MTIALIAIPHQVPARIIWFDDREHAITTTGAVAILEGQEPPNDFDDAVSYLTDDWNGYLLVESTADLPLVANYKGHQHIRVHAMFTELLEEFLPEEVTTDET